MSDIQLGIVGAGNIAREHLKVIEGMKGVSAKAISSRTLLKAKRLAESFKIAKVFDSINEMIDECKIDGIMVLVSANQIFNVLLDLLPKGIPLFIEKPPGLNPKQTKELATMAENYNTKNMVGFNRRYYSVFHEGIKIIKENGNLLGLSVEGHERFWKQTNNSISKELRNNWLYANSTHTIDLLRFFGGETESFNSISSTLKEKNGDQYVASMKFDSGALGTYTSHWYSPGGWSATLFGEGITVIFKPLEKGVWIDDNFISYDILSNDKDMQYKPGFYDQLNAFCNLLKNDKLEWPAQDLSDSCKTMNLAARIANTS